MAEQEKQSQQLPEEEEEEQEVRVVAPVNEETGELPTREETTTTEQPEEPPTSATSSTASKHASNSKSSKDNLEDTKRLQELEAKAVAEATATADAAFAPSPSLLNAATAAPLLTQIDGPSLSNYEGKESIYVGRSVPVAAGSKLHVPIQVSSPGSIVEYSVENKYYDIAFGIVAEREEGVTVVKDVTRVDASHVPITGKFLVGSVPCLIHFKFENDYSWYRDKSVSYKVVITPPTRQTLMAGRRRRARACLKTIEEDLSTLTRRFDAVSEDKAEIQSKLDELIKEMEEVKASLDAVQKDEDVIQDRLTLRESQKDALIDRLENGWQDEAMPAASSGGGAQSSSS
eukprot:Nitzschia sp. Nitz4//scaffold72_size95085//29490//30674//NITZ4_004751-RA/size95085-processed-gene-0.91-mRNA-1//-1//CDS//3329557348//3281//frame0